MFNTSSYLDEKQRLVEDALDAHLPPEDSRPAVLHKAMRYSVFSGGKRLRPILCLAAAETFGAGPATALTPSIAVELVHTYSLIHDDLPAMDNDDLRRGKPTCHVVFGEAQAILAGDALLTLAFELLAQYEPPAPYNVSQFVLELARSAGDRGMVAGQVEDIVAEGTVPVPEQVDYIHLHKTADIISAAVRMGAMAASSPEEQLAALTCYGRNIGLAFQIVDDLLNETSTEAVLGKPVGSDGARKKATYVALHGVEPARQKAEELIDAATGELDKIKENTDALTALAHFVTARMR